jgi:hypothetical protein
MTVKEVVKVLKNAQKITIGYGANVIPCNVQDPLVLSAFGDYVIDSICAIGEDEYEIDLAISPVKEVEHAS